MYSAGGEHLDEAMIRGQITGPAAAARLASLLSAEQLAASVSLSPEQEFAEAHAKLKKIAEALIARDQKLSAQKDAQASGSSPLSWRVHLLPFLGEDELYAKFDLSQPWDSEATCRWRLRCPKSTSSALIEAGLDSFSRCRRLSSH